MPRDDASSHELNTSSKFYFWNYFLKNIENRIYESFFTWKEIVQLLLNDKNQYLFQFEIERGLVGILIL